MPVRAELRGLPKELAKVVMAHLVAAQEWLEEDPELALRHAQAARRRAARLPVVREATAEAAYAAGEFSTALTEYRAVQRITGDDNYWPVIADCERAIGRQEQALRTIQEAHEANLEPTQRVELTLVEAGLRNDMGQRDEALRLLREAIGRREGSHESQARLRYAYADFLETQGDTEGAGQWFGAAAGLDSDKALDTRERLEALGVDVGEEDPDDNDDLVIEEDDRLDEPVADEPGIDETGATGDEPAAEGIVGSEDGDDGTAPPPDGGHEADADRGQVDPGDLTDVTDEADASSREPEADHGGDGLGEDAGETAPLTPEGPVDRTDEQADRTEEPADRGDHGDPDGSTEEAGPTATGSQDVSDGVTGQQETGPADNESEDPTS